MKKEHVTKPSFDIRDYDFIYRKDVPKKVTNAVNNIDFVSSSIAVRANVKFSKF